MTEAEPVVSHLPQLSHSHFRTLACEFRCESAKVRMREGEDARMRGCEDARMRASGSPGLALDLGHG